MKALFPAFALQKFFCRSFIHFLLLALMAGIWNTAWGGKIIRPWRATTAIVKQGETFEIWYDADVGQSISSIDIKSKYLEVNGLGFNVTSGNWQYDLHTNATYNQKVTVTVPAGTPEDRYELILNTNNGDENSEGAVKVVQDWRNEYYVVGTGCAHRYQSYDANNDGNTNDDDNIHLLRKLSEILKVADIMDVQLFFEAGDNIYKPYNNAAYYNGSGGRPNRSRHYEYYHGIEELGIIGVHTVSAATFMTAGNHEAYDATANGETPAELAQFFNDEWGLYYHGTAYGNGRYMCIGNGWGGGQFDPAGQAEIVRDEWLNLSGSFNFVANIMHKKEEAGTSIYAKQPFDLSMVAHNHTYANNNPLMIPLSGGGFSPAMQYVADSNKDRTRFELNLFKVNNTNGTFTTPSGLDSRTPIIQGDVQSQMNNHGAWVRNLELNYTSNNDGNSPSNSATITNRYSFQIDDAKIRFVMPLGSNYSINNGYIRQSFDGDFYHIVDVAVDAPTGDTTVSIVQAAPSPNNAQYINQNVDTSFDPGETKSVDVIVKNIGTDTWSVANGQQLGSQNPTNNTTWGISRVPLTQTVAPDQQYTFTFNVTAPLTPGLYDFRWQMIDEAGTEQGWFGGMTPNIEIQVGPAPIHREAESHDVNQGFQSQATTDVGGGLNIGWATPGDYMEYYINITEAGTYAATFRTASPSNGANFDVSLGGNILATVDEPATGGNQTWATSPAYNFDLPAGTITLRITALDSSWNFNWFKLQFLGGNLPPQITSTIPSDLYLDVGESFNYTLTATDPDGDPVTLSAPTLPSWLSFNPASGLLNGTPTVSDIGPNPVTLRASDGGLHADQSFPIEVSAAGNDAPYATSGAASNTVEGQSFNYTLTAADADGDIVSFSEVTVPTWLSFNTSSGVLSGSAGSAEIGLHNVVLGMSDGTVLVEHNLSFLVFENAMPPNRVLNPSFEDGPEANPSFWTPGSGHVATTANANAGSSRSLRVMTGNTGSTLQNVALQANTTYNISVMIDASQMTSGNIVFDTADEYDGNGQGQFVMYNANSGWEPYNGQFTTGPADTDVTLRIFAEGTFAGTVYYDDIVIVEDVAAGNASPLFDTDPPTEAEVGVEYVYNFNAQDLEGDTLTYSQVSVPTWLTFDGGLKRLSGTPAAGDVGPNSVTIRVSDGPNQSDQTFSITVTNSVDPDSDNDNDGVTYLMELALGGDPDVPDAAVILPEVEEQVNGFDFKFDRARAGTAYVLESSEDLLNWTTHTTVNDTHALVGQECVISIDNSEITNGKKFFRLRVTE